MPPLLVGAIVGTALSVLFYLLIGQRDRKRARRLDVYFFDGWTLDKKMVAATVFSSSTSLATVVIALLQLGAVFGLAFMWATISFSAGWFAMWLFSPLIRARVHRTDTIHTFLGRGYSSPLLGYIASTATILGLMGLFATELFAADIVLRSLHAPTSWMLPAVIAFGAVTIIYASLGGFRSAVRSDWSQVGLLFVALLVLSYLTMSLWRTSGSPEPLLWGSHNRASLPLAVAVSLFFINVPFPFVDMQAWQRLVAATSIDHFRRGTIGAIVAFVLSWTLLIVLSVFIAPGLDTSEEPLGALMDTARQHSFVPSFLLGCVLVPGLFAAMFSSADGFLNSASATFSLDLARLTKADPAADVSRIAPIHTAAIGIVALVLTLLFRTLGFGVVDLVFAVSAGQLALLPAVLAVLCRRPGATMPDLKWPAIASVVAGFGAAWLGGFYSVSDQNSGFVLWRWLECIVPRDTYRTPIYAVTSSVCVFAIGYLFTRLGKATTRSATP